MKERDRIGIVGTGRMGANIARRLKDTGYSISAVFDVQPESSAKLAVELGAIAAQSLATVSKRSDIILTVVSDDAAMQQIFATSGDSLLQHARGKVFVNCATVTPRIHVEVQALCEEHGAHSLEACMASSIPQARNGTLYLMCAGRRETFERVRPMLALMSSALTYLGEAGKAAQVKALVNMVMNINTAGLAEGLGLGEALGIDLDTLRRIFSQTGAASRVLETDGEDMQKRDHEAYFTAAHAAKDSGIALELSHRAGLQLPLAEATYAQYEHLNASGLGHLDKSGIAELTFKSRRAVTT